MSWDSLMAFVAAEAPSFLRSISGVSADAIANAETVYRLRLPENYRRFLLLMGEDSNGFYLFGPGQVQTFADLVKRLPDESYPDRFFRIASAADDTAVGVRIDHFLDLGRSDGVDAPIVMWGSDDEFDPNNVMEKGFTFLEQMYRRLFAHIADQRVPDRLLVAIPHRGDEQAASSLSSVITVLERMRFNMVISPLLRVACLRREGIWALVAVHLGGRGFALSLWSADQPTLEAVGDQLAIQFPNATVQSRGRLNSL